MPEGLFPRVVMDEPLSCPGCGCTGTYQVPLIVDWRDRETVELMQQCCPTVRCQACGADFPLTRPIVVIRPGDPIPLIAGLPWHTDVDSDVEVLRQAMRHPAMPAPAPGRPRAPLPTRLDHLGSLACRYSGFALAGFTPDNAEEWSETDEAWLDLVRDKVTVPRLLAEFAEFIQAAPVSREQIARDSDGLLDSDWSPVVDEIVERTAAAQTDPAAAEEVRRRARALHRLRWGAGPDPDEASLDEQTADLLNRTGEEDHRSLEGLATLRALTERLRAGQPDGPLLVATLISYGAAVISSPHRTPEDIESVVGTGAEAVTRAEACFGAAHQVTLTARQDYAAALLARQQGVPADNERQALALLAQTAVVAAQTGSRDLPDILQNWAGALGHHYLDGRTDNQEQALSMYLDAMHVQRVLRPRDRRGAIMIRLNTAAVLRERRIGDTAAAARDALTTYGEILEDPASTAVLSPAETAQAWINMVSALFQLHVHAPGEVTVADVQEGVDAATRRCESLAEGDLVRIRGMSNLGAVLSQLYQSSASRGDLGEATLQAALRLTGQAAEEGSRWLPPGHDERLRTGMHHAVNLILAGREAGGHAHEAEQLLRDLLAGAMPNRLAGHCYAIARNLGQLYLNARRWRDAALMYETALTSVQTLYRDARSRESRLAELAIASDLVGWLVAALLQSRDAEGAVDAIERSRARMFDDIAHTRPSSAGHGGPPAPRPLLYVGVGPVASWVILVQPGEPPGGLLVTMSADEVRPRVAAVRRARTAAQLEQALDQAGELLGENLVAPAYLMLEAHGIRDVDVVASGLVAGLPLHAMPAACLSGKCWLDLAAVRYVPTQRVARSWCAWPGGGLGGRLAGPGEEPAGPGLVLALADPGADLDCAKYEPDMLPARFGLRLPVPAGSERKRWLLESLRRASLLHLACHARWDSGDPLGSAIELGYSQRVSVGEILESGCPVLDLAVLSCCSTGVAAEQISDELLGFGFGMLLAGARSVVVSNWDIGDLPGSLIMARFYRLLDDGTEPTAALRLAQLWTAHLRVADLSELVNQSLDGEPSALLPAGLAAEVLGSVLMRPSAVPGHRPFRHPVYWAGYSFHGPGPGAQAPGHPEEDRKP